MWKSNLIIALRVLGRNKTISLINVEALRFQNVIVLWVFSNSLFKKSVWAFLIFPPLAVFTCRQVEMRHRFEYLWTNSIPKTSSSAA